MEKHGLAKLGQGMGNLAAGKLASFKYLPEKPAKWELSADSNWILINVKIVDVDNGGLFDEEAIIIQGQRFGKRIRTQEVVQLTGKPEIERVIDGMGYYLVPGMSDIHCHVSLISEYGMKLSSLHYFDAQRMKNCEYAFSKGCTTVRDSGGAYDMIHGLIDRIENRNLLGPRIIPSYTVLTPKGGMWDVNGVMNKMATMLFGGKLIDYANNAQDIKDHINEVVKWGAQSIKIYLEDKPLYGGKEDTSFSMFTDEQVEYIHDLADLHGKITESHAMFINGARKAIRNMINSVAHLTVDEPYTADDAELMASNNVALVPTFGVGSYLAMDCGSEGFPENEEYLFFREMLRKHCRSCIETATLPELRKAYLNFYNFIERKIENRKMAGFGKVHARHCHGFGVNAPASMKNFRKAGTKIGVGTDGGNGITFPGSLDIEFESFLRYGYSSPEILRMATLGNMEIIKMDESLGSIAEGKMADMLLVRENPLDNIMAMTSPASVFKEGYCYINKNKELIA